MSHVPAASLSASVLGSASTSEKNASSSVSPPSQLLPPPLPPPPPTRTTKLRSCVVCRTRKVRCDKLSPCSNCRRANIACVSPSSTPRRPRWARRLDQVNNDATSSVNVTQEAGPATAQDLTERLRYLENLVKELSGQLEQANVATAGSTPGRDADQQMETSSTAGSTGLQKQFGRLVLQGTNRSRYVSNGFWSRVNDEIDGLKMDDSGITDDGSDTSEDEDSPGKTPSTQELERTPSERHSFFFGHNLDPTNPNLREFHPLPSQIPFLLNVFTENVNVFFQLIHVPIVTKMLRDLRDNHVTSLTPANEALMFSIYYAAVTSMEEEDIRSDFGCTKADLNLKYRLGLEYALAKADFLNVSDIVLVQAFTIFLFLVRRHDSPRFVWMMTGLVIRMAQALGLHRDGSRFDHLSPYETEIRRRVWWAVCILDLRASEDQGMDLTITSGSFDTKFPSNLSDGDLDPQMKEIPPARESITDMTFTVVCSEMCDTMRRLTTGEGASTPEDKSRLLNEIYASLERSYLQYSTDSGDIVEWVAVNSVRLSISKMTLIIYLPILFSSPSEQLSEEIRAKLLIAAIEVAEYNHTLNSEKAARQWRWIFQTYTHWHAIVYLLIEAARHPWSPMIERAWVALHSSWLIPVQSKTDKNMRIWFPLRKLMAKARKHRDAELDRLRQDPQAASQLEMEDAKFPLPASSGPFSTGKSDDLFRKRWRKLVGLSKGAVHVVEQYRMSTTTAPSIVVHETQQVPSSVPTYNNIWSPVANSEPVYHPNKDQSLLNTVQGSGSSLATMANPHGENESYHAIIGTPNTLPTLLSDWSNDQPIDSNIMPWLWSNDASSLSFGVDMEGFADNFSLDVNMDLDGSPEVNWYNWVESAKGMEMGGDNHGHISNFPHPSN